MSDEEQKSSIRIVMARESLEYHSVLVGGHSGTRVVIGDADLVSTNDSRV